MDNISANHIVQFYGDDDRSLVAGISRYLAEGIKQDDGVLMIATLEHIEATVRLLKLHAPYREAIRTGRLVCLDAQTTLHQITVDGQPHWERFETVVNRAMASVHDRTGHTRVRAYGEIVDLLWKAGQAPAAMRLEDYWNTMLAASDDSRLFCAYGIDVLDHQLTPTAVAPILCSHAHLLPLGEALEFAIDWAVEEFLGASAKEIERHTLRPEWGALPRTMTTILWLKDHFPDAADRVLGRAREFYHL